MGGGNTADGLKSAKSAEYMFSEVMSGQGPFGEGAGVDLRRAASDGIAYVRSLASALLPKIWSTGRRRIQALRDPQLAPLRRPERAP